LIDVLLPRLRLAMIDMLKIRPVPDEADHAAHSELADAIADRDPVAAAAASRSHLSSLKEAYS
jgi:DNA-binding FadR family transcriptional regulator